MTSRDEDESFEEEIIRLSGQNGVPAAPVPAAEKDEPTELKALPALGAYQKTYATSLGNNDGKAIKLFKEFESQEKVRRLKSELLAIAQRRVSDELCQRILGPVRKSKFGGFDAWAKYALGFVNSAAR